MKEILLLSGKGGTGKTSLTASFVSLSGQCVAADYDVDATNLPILLNSALVRQHEFCSGKKAIIDQERCIQCGLCEEVCRFGAIMREQVDVLACEGCAYCSWVCPMKAIHMQEQSSGRWFEGNIPPDLTIFYAELYPGEENSGKLVAQVKNAARRKCLQQEISLLIADGPPGIGCQVNSALVGVTLVVIVAEPSISCIHDLQRLKQLLDMRDIQSVLIINKYDLHLDIAGDIHRWAQENQVRCIGEIPYHPQFANAAHEGKPPANYPELKALLTPVWQRILEIVGQNSSLSSQR